MANATQDDSRYVALTTYRRDGRAVTKVGPFDGHLTNADAYADSSLVGVIYVPLPPPRRR